MYSTYALSDFIQTGHFVFASGRHSDTYFAKIILTANPTSVSRACADLSYKINSVVDVVVGPAIGGVILSNWLAYHLKRRQMRDVLAVYAEKADIGFAIRPGFHSLLQGKRILVIEDVLTTGGSVRGVIEALKPCGVRVVGVGALLNRGGVTAMDLGVPTIVSLLDQRLADWLPEDCPLCKAGIPINQIK